MSKLEQLLKGVDVEWKTLGEIGEIIRGVRITKRDLLPDGTYPVVSGGVGFMGYINQYNREEDTITIAQYGTAGYVKWQTEKFWANDVCFCIKPNTEIILNRFLYFFLVNKQQYIYDISNRTAVPYSIERDKILKLPIPIPPLSVQAEIVRILDTFTALTAELTAELTARKKQYNYYREQLLMVNGEGLMNNEEVEWKTLGEVVLSTSNIRWKDTLKSFRYIDLTSVCRDKNLIIETTEIYKDNAPSRAQKLLLENDIIFATTRPTQQRLCLITEEYSGEIASTGYCVLRANTKVILPKWIYFWITSNQFKKYVEENQSGSAYPAISDSKVKEFPIPIPSLKEQARIVSILDKFDMLTTSISDGLPREIELRKKQYEHYRDLLLTFNGKL